MDHIICLNTNSFPAKNKGLAFELFYNSLQGLLSLNSGSDRFLMYFDHQKQINLSEFNLADGFTYNDYIDELKAKNDYDLVLFLQELEDKSPAIDFISEDDIDNIAKYIYYIPGRKIDNNCDVYAIAMFLSGTLLSINTDDIWSHPEIKIKKTDDGKHDDQELHVRNISCKEHGKIHSQIESEEELNSICDGHNVSEYILKWYDELSPENKHKTSEKIRLACKLNFSGGEPLFKSLNHEGLREIRFSAYSGGAIRVLFKHLKDSSQAILVGFIKKSNNEGYDFHIKKAIEIYENINMN